MPRAFLIKKHHATSLNSKRRFKISAEADRNDGFHLAAEAKDYVKTSLASDSGSETCSTPSNSPSPQPYHPHNNNYGFLKDDVPVNATAAAAEWVARSSLNVYSRSSSVLEPLNMNMNASRQASTVVPSAAWIHAPLFPSYLPLYYSTLRHHQASTHHSSSRAISDIYYGYHPSSRTSDKSLSPSSSAADAHTEDIVITDDEHHRHRKDDDIEDSSTASSSYCDISSQNSSKVDKDNDRHVQVAINMVSNKNNNHSTWSNDESSSIKSVASESCSSSSSSSTTSTTTLSVSGCGRRRNSDGPRYNCPDCNKSYSTHSGLSKHQQFHCATNNKRSFSCKYCDKIYVSLGALKMHIRTHTLPCKCKLCGKAFSRPWLLQGHIRTHTGEKPFSCPHCNRAFADRSNLRAHLQTHSDIKKYSCKSCAKTFSRMSLLLKHEDGGCGATYDGAVNPLTAHDSLQI